MCKEFKATEPPLKPTAKGPNGSRWSHFYYIGEPSSLCTSRPACGNTALIEYLGLAIFLIFFHYSFLTITSSAIKVGWFLKVAAHTYSNSIPLPMSLIIG
jgi:hypothetical protein